jgi:hypothetical protein
MCPHTSVHSGCSRRQPRLSPERRPPSTSFALSSAIELPHARHTQKKTPAPFLLPSPAGIAGLIHAAAYALGLLLSQACGRVVGVSEGVCIEYEGEEEGEPEGVCRIPYAPASEEEEEEEEEVVEGECEGAFKASSECGPNAVACCCTHTCSCTYRCSTRPHALGVNGSPYALGVNGWPTRVPARVGRVLLDGP